MFKDLQIFLIHILIFFFNVNDADKEIKTTSAYQKSSEQLFTDTKKTSSEKKNRVSCQTGFCLWQVPEQLTH